MFLAEPPPTAADLHFRLFGIPVRVHPFFWIVVLILGISGQEKADPVETLLWVAIVFLSILVHELGHAFLQRRYGGNPWITLHGFGGLASCEDCDRSPRRQILISLAGPVAGFLLAVLVIVLVRVSGHQIGILPRSGEVNWETLGVDRIIRQPLLLMSVYFEPFGANPLNFIVADLLQVNIMWGLVNLLPMYPLDGGRIARELFTLSYNPRKGIIQSLWLSMVTAGLVGIYGLSRGSIFMLLMFGYLAYSNYQTLQAYQRGY